MILNLTLIINLLWAIVMIAAHGSLAFGNYSNSRALVLSLSIAYVVIAFIAFKKRIWARIICFIVAAFLMLRWLPMVSINFWLYFNDAPIYTNSPDAILIVVIISMVYAIPATIVALSLLVHLWPMAWNQIRNKIANRYV